MSKSSTKRLSIIVLVVATMILAVIWQKPTVQASSNIPFEANYEQVVSAPIGYGDGELGYGDADTTMSGPASFAVADNGDIYVLDNYNARIAVFSGGKWLRNIDYSSFITYGYIMTLHNNSIYLFDHNYFQKYSYIVKMSLNGELQERYSFDNMDMPQDVRELAVINGRVTAISYKTSPDEFDRLCFILDDVTNCVVKTSTISSARNTISLTAEVLYGDTSWSIKLENNSAVITPIWKDRNGELITEYIDDTSKTIRKYNANNELIGVIFSGDMCKGTVYIRNNTFIANDGTTYMSFGFRDELVIAKVDFVNPSMLKQYAQMQEEHLDNFALQNQNTVLLATDFTQPSVTGAQAISTGNSMANLAWTIISLSNTTSTSTITVPSPYCYASVGTSFVGIPYCYGGMMGTTAIGTTMYKKKFTDAISLGYKAGNINTNDNYIANSAGIDCSGFVARCLGQTSKNNTAWYLDSFGHAYSNYSSLQPGDYLVKDGHMMLVVQRIDANQIRVLESTTREGYNRSINRIVTLDYFGNFTPMSAYHRAGSSWYYTSTQHFHKCHFSGCTSTIKFNAAAHNLVLNASQTLYICTVCGYSASAGGGSTSFKYVVKPTQ